MRRFIALLIMFIVPLQFAWSTASGLHGHLGEDVEVVGMHAHDHDYHNAGHNNHDLSTTGGTASGHDLGHDGSHCHHILSFILPESSLTFDLHLSGVSNPQPPDVFFTRIPSLLERPPLARA